MDETVKKKEVRDHSTGEHVTITSQVSAVVQVDEVDVGEMSNGDLLDAFLLSGDRFGDGMLTEAQWRDRRERARALRQEILRRMSGEREER
jgi:hypothetical protein